MKNVCDQNQSTQLKVVQLREAKDLGCIRGEGISQREAKTARSWCFTGYKAEENRSGNTASGLGFFLATEWKVMLLSQMENEGAGGANVNIDDESNHHLCLGTYGAPRRGCIFFIAERKEGSAKSPNPAEMFRDNRDWENTHWIWQLDDVTVDPNTSHITGMMVVNLCNRGLRSELAEVARVD